MWGTLFTTFSGTGLLEFVFFTHGGGWDFCMDMWVWIFHADFLVRIFGCGFFLRILGADFFADFVMACADFWCGFFLRIFWAVFPQKKP